MSHESLGSRENPQNQNENKWENGFTRLLAYHAQNGTFQVPYRYVCKDGYPLGRWLGKQKELYKAEMLREDRKARLEEAGCGLQTGYAERRWEYGYTRLLEYKNEYGSCDVPFPYVCEDGYLLGEWYNNQKVNARKNTLKPERKEKLIAAGCDFACKKNNATREEMWEDGYAHLIEYREKIGLAHITNRFVCEDGYHLGWWLRDQKRNYMAGKLRESRRKMLQKAGVSFAPVPKNEKSKRQQREERWDAGLAHLAEYTREHEYYNLSQSYTCEDGYNLGFWLKRQRAAFIDGSLSEEKISRMKKAGYDIENTMGTPGGKRNKVVQVISEKWLNGLKHLREGIEKGKITGPVSIRYVCEDGFKLGMWMRDQRRLYMKGRLLEKKEKLISETGYDINAVRMKGSVIKPERWENGLRHLIAYREETGGFRISNGYVCEDGYSLATWLNNQIIAYRTGRLRPDREKMLREAGYDLHESTLDRKTWEYGLAKFIKYVKQSGTRIIKRNCVIDGYNLSNWKTYTLQKLRDPKYVMTEAQKKMLRDAGFDYFEQVKNVPLKIVRKYLEAFAKEHPNERIPDDFVAADGFPLGRWANLDTQSRNDILKEYNIPVPMLKKDKKWEYGYEKLVEYIQKSRSPNIDVHYVTEDGFRLGAWVRSQYSQLLKSNLEQSTKYKDTLEKLIEKKKRILEAGILHLTNESARKAKKQDDLAPLITEEDNLMLERLAEAAESNAESPQGTNELCSPRRSFARQSRYLREQPQFVTGSPDASFDFHLMSENQFEEILLRMMNEDPNRALQFMLSAPVRMLNVSQWFIGAFRSVLEHVTGQRIMDDDARLNIAKLFDISMPDTEIMDIAVQDFPSCRKIGGKSAISLLVARDILRTGDMDVIYNMLIKGRGEKNKNRWFRFIKRPSGELVPISRRLIDAIEEENRIEIPAMLKMYFFYYNGYETYESEIEGDSGDRFTIRQMAQLREWCDYHGHLTLRKISAKLPPRTLPVALGGNGMNCVFYLDGVTGEVWAKHKDKPTRVCENMVFFVKRMNDGIRK